MMECGLQFVNFDFSSKSFVSTISVQSPEKYAILLTYLMEVLRNKFKQKSAELNMVIVLRQAQQISNQSEYVQR